MVNNMNATPKKHICIERRKNCRREWTAMSVEDEPIYTVCSKCVEQDCLDEQELMKEVS